MQELTGFSGAIAVDQAPMHLYSLFRTEILKGVAGLGLPEGLPLSAVAVEPTRDAAHGDLATNAAMVLAKPAGTNPRELAAKLQPALATHPMVAKVEVAGPGFINLTLKPDIWPQLVQSILASGVQYGDSAMGAGEQVNVEYVSANPTGPMHIGHARGAVVGDALAALLKKAGFAVTKEYYVNDAGAQVEKLATSLFLRYREALGEAITIPEGHYPGDYLIPPAQAIAQKDGDTWLKTEWKEYFREQALTAMMGLIRADLAQIHVQHDVYRSEREVVAQYLESSYAELDRQGLIYQGVLEPPKGKLPDDWEAREQTLFKATQFGDDVDRPLKKSDGSWTYFAGDVAYHADKLKRGFTRMVLVLGQDHGGYQKRLSALVKALSGGKAHIDILLYGLVKFMQNGEAVKMSKRSGTFLEIGDVVEAVGADATRFLMLTRKANETIDFDFAKVKEQTKDNPVFYVQYAHARAHSVLRNAALEGFAPATNHQPSATPAELALLRKLAEWPRVVEQAALAHEPHRIAYYLQELAAEFHGLWAQVKFIVPEDKNLTQARLAMVNAVAIVVASGLHVFGVQPVESM